MANPTGPFGLRPVRHKNGAPWNGATVPVYCSASYATALYVGDPVVISLVTAERDALGRYLSVNKSAGTDGIVVQGAIVSFEPDPDDLTKVYRAASTARIANVCMDQTVIYHIRGDGGGTPAATWVGINAVMIANTAGSTTTGLSGMMLDEGTTTAPDQNQSYPLVIEGIANIPNNDLGDNVIWEVSLNTFFNATGLVLGTTVTS
jgi:hypothetical protein